MRIYNITIRIHNFSKLNTCRQNIQLFIKRYKIKAENIKKFDKQNSHTNVHRTFVPKNFNETHFTSIQNKITSQKSRQFTQQHLTSHHFTYLHSIPN
jgi:copper homeostasis protein CutC